MPDNNPAATPATQNEIRESTCIHTKKIYDSCQAKDCVEDLRLYPLLSCVRSCCTCTWTSSRWGWDGGTTR